MSATLERVRLADLKPGDVIVAGPGAGCVDPGHYAVRADSEGDLFVLCLAGMHYLEHAARPDGTLAGFSRGAHE